MADENAEASGSSSRPRETDTQRSQRAFSRVRTAAAGAHVDNDGSMGGSEWAKSPDALAAQSRRVRTVPPSAMYEPSTPPSPLHSPLPLTSSTTNFPPPPAHRKRPRPRLRYSTSGSSATDLDESGSDDEPLWWTFTQRGMAKMRARNMRKKGDVEMAMGEVESGRESGKEKTSKRRFRSHSGSSGPFSSRPIASDLKNVSSISVHNNKRLHPLPIRTPSSPGDIIFRRSPGRDLSSFSVQAPLVRSNSAPTSPIQAGVEVPSPGMTTLVADAEEPSDTRESTHKGSIPLKRVMSPKRHMTLPVIPRANLTDSEVLPGRQSSRMKGRDGKQLFDDTVVLSVSQAANGFGARHGLEASTRPHGRRRQSTRLRLNLPPPITHHFAHGWPHAGSWHDALYGNYDEEQSGGSRRSSAQPKKPVPSRLVTPKPDHSSPARHDLPQRAKSKTRRTKRYRQALAPPTPAGLGFAVSDENWKQGRVNGHAFEWGPGTLPGPSMDIDEEDGLSRSETRATMNEKRDSQAVLPKKPWWVLGLGRGQKPDRKVEEVEWRKKWRRIVFLDVRVTIWIRAFNLAVVVVLLGLAITIRLDLSHLNLPGLIGSSTILIIIYSCPTILHVLTAIYREYFGRPIGLWGLRSKMLWVCLDLLFVALWSSAMSLATNDFISTPLECSSGSPWWRGGLAENYADLLQDLHAGNATRITDVSLVSHSLGFVLPDEILRSGLANEICKRQAGCIGLALLALLLYGGNMVLSLFRIFETVRRTANVGKAVNTWG